MKEYTCKKISTEISLRLNRRREHTSDMSEKKFNFSNFKIRVDKYIKYISHGYFTCSSLVDVN